MLVSFAVSELICLKLIAAGQPAELVTVDDETMIQVHDAIGVMYSVDSDKLGSYGVRIRNVDKPALFVKSVKHALFNEIATEVAQTIKVLKDLKTTLVENVLNEEPCYFTIWKKENRFEAVSVDIKPDWVMAPCAGLNDDDAANVICLSSRNILPWYYEDSLSGAGRFWNNTVSYHWLRDHYAIGTDGKIDLQGLCDLIAILEQL